MSTLNKTDNIIETQWVFEISSQIHAAQILSDKQQSKNSKDRDVSAEHNVQSLSECSIEKKLNWKKSEYVD